MLGNLMNAIATTITSRPTRRNKRRGSSESDRIALEAAEARRERKRAFRRRQHMDVRHTHTVRQ